MKCKFGKNHRWKKELINDFYNEHDNSRYTVYSCICIKCNIDKVETSREDYRL